MNNSKNNTNDGNTNHSSNNTNAATVMVLTGRLEIKVPTMVIPNSDNNTNAAKVMVLTGLLDTKVTPTMVIPTIVIAANSNSNTAISNTSLSSQNKTILQRMIIKDRNIALILQNNSTKISCEEKQTRRTKISSDPKVQRQTRRKEEEHTKQNSHHRCDDTYNRHGARKWHEFLKRTRHSNKCIFHHNDTTIDSKQSWYITTVRSNSTSH